MDYLSKKKSLIIIFCLLFAFTTCKKGTKSDKNTVLLDTIRIQQTHYLDNDTTKVKCNLLLIFVYPQAYKNPEETKKLQKIFIGNVLSGSLDSLSPQEAADSYVLQYIKNFDELNNESFNPEDYSLSDESDFTYYQVLQNEVVYNKYPFISFVVKSENYEGGAHGAHSVYGYVIDLETGKLLSEDTFAGENYQKGLSALILQKIANANDLQNVEQLKGIGYDRIEDAIPNGNFTIDDKGITYYYNEYDIAAYFIGTTQVFIPFDELKDYLSENNPITSLAGLE
jgi:hypothetical protein